MSAQLPDTSTSPQLVEPTIAVRESFLHGNRIECALRGTGTEWLDQAAADFTAYVDSVRGVHIRWGVPSTVFWYVWESDYIGSLIIRHRLTPELAEAGGHIGYDVVPPWRQQGHATRMLGEGLRQCRALGLERVLVTCAVENEPSRRVILKNGGIPDGRARGEDRFWITVP